MSVHGKSRRSISFLCVAALVALAVVPIVITTGAELASAGTKVVPCTKAMYTSVMDDAKMTPALLGSINTESLVLTMAQRFHCNQWTGGFTPAIPVNLGFTPGVGPTFVYPDPGSYEDSGLMVAEPIQANPTVGQPYDFTVRMSGPLRTVNIPSYPPLPNCAAPGFIGPCEPTVAYTIRMRPIASGDANQPLNSRSWVHLYVRTPAGGLAVIADLYFDNPASRGGEPCARVGDFFNALEDLCTIRVISWASDAAARLAESDMTAFLALHWTFGGARSNSACAALSRLLCELFYGQGQAALVPIQVGSTAPQHPVAAFTAEAATAGSRTWNFDGSTSAAFAPSTLVRYKWEFGDPDNTIAFGAKASFTYPKDAKYTVKLTVTDSVNVEDFVTKDIDVVSSLIVNSTGDAANASNSGEACDTGNKVDNKPECTLRAAIEAANASGKAQPIAFAIAGTGAPVITVATSLPAINAPVSVDGTSQPGGWVRLDGPTAATPAVNGLVANAPGVTISGFAVSGFSVALGAGTGSSNTIIRGNRVGVGPTGAALAPPLTGVFVAGAGAGATVTNNVVTAQATAIRIGSSTAAGTATVTDNRVGVDAAAGASLAQLPIQGIEVSGPATVQNNVVSAKVVGVRVNAGGDGPSAITGNNIGVNAQATAFTTMGVGVLANGGTGTVVTANTVAGATPEGGLCCGWGDIIVAGVSQYDAAGTLHSPSSALSGAVTGTDIVVRSNTIGTLANGTARASGNSGVLVYGNADRVTIDDNDIAGHSQADVNVDTGSRVAVTANRIGVDRTGNAVRAAGSEGVRFGYVQDSSIDGNTIGGEGDGIIFGESVRPLGGSPDSIRIARNRVGVGANGNTKVGNRRGVSVKGTKITIGPDNVISGNTEFGIHADVSDEKLSIIGNRIGTNNAGTVAVPNKDGVVLDGRSSGEVVQNVISGNTGTGLWVLSSESFAVTGNRIGTSSSGGALGNGVGVRFEHGKGAVVENELAHSGAAGIAVGTDARVVIRSNVTTANAGKGIDAPSAPEPPQLDAVLVDVNGQKRLWFVVSNTDPKASIQLFGNSGCQGDPDEGEVLIDYTINGGRADGTSVVLSTKPRTAKTYAGYTITSTVLDPGANDPTLGKFVGRTTEYSVCATPKAYPDHSGTGIPDIVQIALEGTPGDPTTARFPADAGGIVVLKADSGKLTNVGPSNAPAPPGGYTFPAAQFSFSLTGLTRGAAASVAVTLSAVTKVVWRYGPPTAAAPPQWYQWPYDPASGVGALPIGGSGWLYKFIDGAQGDDDGLANGTVVDPSAPGVATDDASPSTTSTTTSTSTSTSTSTTTSTTTTTPTTTSSTSTTTTSPSTTSTTTTSPSTTSTTTSTTTSQPTSPLTPTSTFVNGGSGSGLDTGTVESAPPAAAVSSQTAVSFTGADSWVLTLGALALLLCGVLLVVGARRTTSRSDTE